MPNISQLMTAHTPGLDPLKLSVDVRLNGRRRVVHLAGMDCRGHSEFSTCCRFLLGYRGCSGVCKVDQALYPKSQNRQHFMNLPSAVDGSRFNL